MDRKHLVYLHNLVYVSYKDKANIVFKKNVARDDFYTIIESKTIELPEYIKTHPTEWSLFAFLHEIGHIMTNSTKMKRCVQEYLATQWAINEAKRIGFIIPDSFLKTYQNYILKWRTTGIKCGANNVPSCEELTLKY